MRLRSKADPATAELKTILENLRSPDALNDHPWTSMRMVAATTGGSGSGNGGAGTALAQAVAAAFRQMMPSVPPRRGIRLDTRWGEFGLLAARYFAPLQFGTPIPATLRDAWGRIDDSILLYVFGNTDGAISEDDKARYRLVGNEPEVAPMSTLSDWHQNALQHLCELVHTREGDAQRGVIHHAAGRPSDGASRKASAAHRQRWAQAVIGLVLLALALIAVQAYRIYARAVKVREDVRQLESTLQGESMSEAFLQSGAMLEDLERDLTRLKAEAQPFLWLTPGLGWLPRYGGDVGQSGELLDLAIHLSASARYAQSALEPLVPTYDGSPRPPIGDLISMLADAQPQLATSLERFGLARQARDRIDASRLSPGLRELITRRVDPAMSLIGDALPLVAAAPSLLGAGDAGPRTYLLLAQNEDELRPTGGFITAVGKVVVDRGSVVDLSFENSGDLDNWSMPYPMAPWQLSQYMNSRVLVLRDANWFPHFPTATLYIRQLYAYVHQDSVDGIVAFDQHLLVMLLETLGPLQIDSVDYPVGADNVIPYMRQAKSPPADQPVPAGWTNKAFIEPLAEAILDKALNAQPQAWTALVRTLLQAMDERHLLLQVDDSAAAPVLAGRSWNGGLQSEAGDFLMVLDSNVGFNKTNAVVQTRLGYGVNLADLQEPTAELFVSHTNGASADVPCIQWNANGVIPGQETYPIDRCYWDYMRIYVPEGTKLISGTPQRIPPEWMILNRTIPPTIDELDEGLHGVDSFGTLVVVPGNQSVSTGLTLALPAERIITEGPGTLLTYTLTVRKQPGTLAIPLTLRIHLPNGAAIEAPDSGWVLQGSNVLIETDLRIDRSYQVTFRLP